MKKQFARTGPVGKLIMAAVLLTALFHNAATQTAQSGGGSMEPREIESFFDGYLGNRMSADHIAGAAVSVVMGGRTILSKGYGYADIERHIPVDPLKTEFILGSLSKVFTWTAVMQLAERGKLDLDSDVNRYLDFTVPRAFSRPITLVDLMNHTSGFEDNKFGQMAADPERLVPAGQWLAAHIPARVRPAGVYCAYGNYNAALAGYIVERVSGMSYDDYIDENLLKPLGMRRTSSRQPAPDALSADLSRCYIYSGGKYRSREDLDKPALNVAPAGSFKSSATDMAAFMKALLDDGRHGSTAVLKPETLDLMRRRSFSHDPRVNGMAHGFWEMDMNGRRIIGHAGSHFIMNSILMLFPEDGLGVFVVTNSSGGTAFLGENFLAFERDFVNRFFPAVPQPAAVSPAMQASRPDPRHSPGRYSGSYGMTYGRSDSTPEKLASLVRSLTIRSTPDGLIASMPIGTVRFTRTDPLVFSETDADGLLVFHENARGEITDGFYGPIPLTALVRNRWFETPAFNLPLLGFCLLLFLSSVISAPVPFFLRRIGRSAALPDGFPARASVRDKAARSTAFLSSLLSLVAILGAFASLFDVSGLYTGTLPLWPAVRFSSVAVALLTPVLIAFAVGDWRRRSRSLPGRIHYTLLALAAAGFVWFIWFWNILGGDF